MRPGGFAIVAPTHSLAGVDLPGAAVKIAYVLNTYPRPSHSFIRREIRALERRGLEVRRIAMRGVRNELVDSGDIEEHARTEHVLERARARLIGTALCELLRAPRRALGALRLVGALARASGDARLRHIAYLVEACHVVARCRAWGVSHVHAHFGTNAAAVAMLARALGGPSYSFTVHGPEEFDAPHALALDLKMRNAAFTVAISAYGRSQLLRWLPARDWPRVAVVHCGIEPQTAGAAQPLPESGPRVVAVGRLSEQKGHLILIEALGRVVAAHPGLHLTLVGDGPMRPQIEAAICAHGVDGNVSITGWLDESGVRAALQDSHALILPSFAEGLPMVVMEAMAAARPVLATWVAGIPELVRDGQTGWLVPPGDAGALAEAIGALARTPRDRLAAMGRAGRERVLERHDIDAQAARLAALIAQAGD